jgi:hypothetical protein
MVVVASSLEGCTWSFQGFVLGSLTAVLKAVKAVLKVLRAVRGALKAVL